LQKEITPRRHPLEETPSEPKWQSKAVKKNKKGGMQQLVMKTNNKGETSRITLQENKQVDETRHVMLREVEG